MARSQFCTMVDSAIKDEMAADRMYRRTAMMTNNRTLRTIIRSIARDERGHARTWRTIRTLKCR